MARINFDLDMITRDGLKSLVKQLMLASDGDEKKILDRLNSKGQKNDLADLDEEMHGKHSAPKVTKDDMPYEEEDELPDVPKKGSKRGQV